MSTHLPPLARVLLQLGLLIVIWWIGTVIQHFFALPISAGVIGLFLVLIALLFGILKLEWIQAGSNRILSELILFFIPCVVGLINYHDLFVRQGLQIILAVVLGTLCVMLVTAYSVFLGFKLERQFKSLFSQQKAKAAEEQS